VSLIFHISFVISGFNLEVQLLIDSSSLWIGTAKRLRLKAQGCFNPGLPVCHSPTRNGLWQPATTELRLSRPFIFNPRVAEAATLGCRDATASR